MCMFTSGRVYPEQAYDQANEGLSSHCEALFYVALSQNNKTIMLMSHTLTQIFLSL